MKKIVLILLSVILLINCCFALSSCSSVSKSDVVGVWENVTWKEGDFEHYMYVFEDGTCNGYGYWIGEWQHLAQDEWEIQGDLFVRDSKHKYTVEGSKMYNAQGHLIYAKTSYDVGTDIRE